MIDKVVGSAAEMLRMQIDGAKDAGSKMSEDARNAQEAATAAMQALNPANVLGGIGEILKAILPAMSG